MLPVVTDKVVAETNFQIEGKIWSFCVNYFYVIVYNEAFTNRIIMLYK